MSKRRTDFRTLKARRDAAIARPELRLGRKPTLDADQVTAAIAAGKLTKVPARRRRHV